MLRLDLTNIDENVAKEYIIDFLKALDIFHISYNVDKFNLKNENTEFIYNYKPSTTLVDDDVSQLLSLWYNKEFEVNMVR